MKNVRIGIFDEEEAYAGKLSAYLNRMGNGSWNVAAFTDKKAMEEYASRKKPDILAGTDMELLKKLKGQQNSIYIIWLKEKEEENRIHSSQDNMGITSICRYNSAKIIGKIIGEAAAKILTSKDTKKPVVAIYSPVGRCGKTSLALNIVKNENFGKWLYIGMEDYSYLREGRMESTDLDSFLYFVKERNQEKIHFLLQGGQGIIPSAFSPFDTKQINETDIKWLIDVLQQMEMCSGILFDMGTGVLQELGWLSFFDYILVPFLSEEASMGKRRQFEKLVDAYELEEVKEKMRFLNMEDEREVSEKIQEIGLKRWAG